MKIAIRLDDITPDMDWVKFRRLEKMLDENNIEYEILSDTTANIYGSINLSKLVIALAKENCEVLSVEAKDESLESFFITLTGGAGNE